MECPVCYENEAQCRFTCGHGFCKECTKTWYMKGKSTCPMCRGSMCFKGITKLKKRWYREKQEQVYIDLTERIFDELGEDILLQCVEIVQNRFEYTMCKYPDISCEVLNLVLGITWMDVDYLLSVRQEPVYEPMTYEKYLMISKHKKKMSVHYNEVTKRTKHNIVGNCCSASPEHLTFVWQIQEG